MNVLRCARRIPAARHTLLAPSLAPTHVRLASTERPYIPPAQRDEPRRRREPPSLPPPQSPSFYTTRPAYFDQLVQLEKAIGQVRASLKTLQLLPLPAFARASLPPAVPVWRSKEEMGADFETRMTTTRYRAVTRLLNQLNEYYQIASSSGCTDLAIGIRDIVSMFESGKKSDVQTRGKRNKIALDAFGRSYTVGRRKTSSARVWMIPVLQKSGLKRQSATDKEFDLAPDTAAAKMTTTTILVNNLPINEYFPLPADRERITRPLKVGGILGAYNVFALVRGGGTSGQSGAVAHGVAKAVIAHEPELETMFRRAKLTRRDPRMVERKKPGLAKARKAYAWVKR